MPVHEIGYGNAVIWTARGQKVDEGWVSAALLQRIVLGYNIGKTQHAHTLNALRCSLFR